ncbi:unnamed protein product [Penicillium egyptiacum]|uniref:Ankyrin n=1 Tax=Penicillium egyptiacum TaxID=1303716 RepID=A0A9W4KLR5_9EURO|nr:unnamed protein product [Penicillium egyptiacum]
MSEPISETVLGRIEKLPTELIDHIVEASLFSEPLGSHDALHTLQAFCQEEKDSIFKSRIHAVLKSHSIRKRIETSWKLCPNFNHTKTCRHTFDKTAPHDLASKTIVNCAQCFLFLLDHQTIRASSFCQDGQSFYLIAAKSEDLGVIRRILSSIKIQELFKPASVNRGNSECKSILQLTTSNAQSFQCCWERLRLRPEISLSSLRPSEIRELCRFADIDLASNLLDRGVDLGMPDANNGFTSWHALLHQQNPEPMLDWFKGRGLEPPEDLLTYATTDNHVDAARWILHHSVSYEDWRRATFVAAGDLEPKSGEILEVIIQHPPPEYRTDRTLSQDLLIRIVDNARDQSRWYDSYLPGKYFHEWEIDRLQSARACLEEVAVRKIKSVRGLSDGAGVAGIKVEARQAGLHMITEALEAFN